MRPEVWASRRLIPLTPPWLPGPDPFGRAHDQLDLPVHAWTVLTHNSALGRAHRDLTVRNAFGDTCEYALCPATEEVADPDAVADRAVAAAAPSATVPSRHPGPAT
ncbi:hypothetical protein ACFCX0_42305 [Streptomyces sp. NPDC056352]|uniref:hypothetical protein n=1 Tax=Streptomyces sp. NPDC056352 TaxID=3345791 RepID=UPI0035DA94A9